MTTKRHQADNVNIAKRARKKIRNMGFSKLISKIETTYTQPIDENITVI